MYFECYESGSGLQARPGVLVEVKTAERKPTSALRYFSGHLQFKGIQVGLDTREEQQFGGVYARLLGKFLLGLAC